MRNSYAKINLYLDILGKLPDGFHEIRTVFAEIELADTLKFTLTKNKNIQVLANVKSLSNSENLIYKTAALIQEQFSVAGGVTVELEKRIPIAAGMGGGSSNAAATIMVLSDLWGLNLSFEQKRDIASRLGSDISFFLYGGTALGTHRGEVIEPMSRFTWEHILLVKPDFGIAAKEAYAVYRSDGEAHEWHPVREDDLSCCYNALERGVMVHYPLIGRIVRELRDEKAVCAMMTGSGSTCVGFFDDVSAMQRAELRFQSEGFWTCCTRTHDVS